MKEYSKHFLPTNYINKYVYWEQFFYFVNFSKMFEIIHVFQYLLISRHFEIFFFILQILCFIVNTDSISEIYEYICLYTESENRLQLFILLYAFILNDMDV